MPLTRTLSPQAGRGRRGIVLIVESQLLRQLRIKSGNWRPRVFTLRRFLEAFGGRLARPVRGGKIGAAVERIIRRRLKSGARAQAGGALVARRIEQVGKRVRRRRRIRPRCLGARRFRGVFGFFGGLRHRLEYGASPLTRKGCYSRQKSGRK